MNPLTGGDFTQAQEPFALFESWLAQAQATEPNDANAMALASVDGEGMPDVRMVLMKGLDRRGLVFYTNSRSAKGMELAGCMKAAAVFHWKSLRRQVRWRGPVEHVSEAEANAYFDSRPRGSQIGAWASLQSSPLDQRQTLERAVVDYEAKFNFCAVPRPPHWQGYRIQPVQIEFWQDQRSRLHDRIVFSRAGTEAQWTITRLYP